MGLCSMLEMNPVMTIGVVGNRCLHRLIGNIRRKLLACVSGGTIGIHYRESCWCPS